MGGDHHATGEAMYHSRVKKMDKIDAVEKPTTPGRGTGPPNIRQVNDPGSLSKPEKLGSMNGIGAAGLRRAIRAVCAVYSGPDTFGGVLHPVVRSRGGAPSLGFLVGKPTPVSRCYLKQVLSGRSETGHT